MNRLTSDQKRQVLIDAGIDPTKYWLDDNDTVIDMPEQGTAETAVKSTLYNAPRTLAGFAGGALGLATGGTVGTLTGTPALGTVAGLGGMVAGGAAGSKVGESLMSALVPDDWRLAQEAREARSPMTVKVADVASSLALMRPSPTVLRAAARAPGEFLRTAGQMQPQTTEAALNILGGAALGGGMALGQGASMSDVLLETGLGALQHQPTALGTAMSGRLFRPFTDAGAVRPGAAPVASALSAYADELARQQSSFAAKQRQQQELAAAQQAEFATQQKKNAERVTNPAAVAAELEAQRQAELSNRAAADRAAMLREVSAVQPAPRRGPLGEVLPDQPPLFQPKPMEDLRSVDERLAAAGEVPVEQTQAAPVQIERAPEAVGSKFEQSKKMLLSNELYNYFKDWADKFKVTMTRVPEIRRMVDGRLQEMSGEMAPRKEAGGRADIIGSSTAYLDMQPHEIAHNLIHDTINFGSPREQAFMNELLGQLGKEMGQDFTPVRDNEGLLRINAAAEEALVNRITPKVFDKLINPEKVVSIKEAFRDFADYFMRNKLDAKTIERIAVDRMVFGSGAPKAVRKAQLRAFAGPRERLDESAALAEERLRSEMAVTEDARQSALEATDAENAARDAEAARATGEGAGAPEEPGAPAAPGTLELEAQSQTEQQTRGDEMAKLLDERDRQARIAAIDARLKESINRLPISPKRRAQLEADRQALLREFEATRPSLAEEEGAGVLSQAERDIAAQQQFRDTGGEMPSGEPAIGEEYPSLTTPRRTFGVQRPPKRSPIEYLHPEDVTPGTAVSRPETIDYTGESVPANVRRGRAERESARETPEDLEMRRIEDRLSGRDRSRYQPKEEPRPIVSEFEKQLNAERPFAMQPSKDGRIAANVIRAYVAKMPGVERELLEVGKLNDFLTKTPRPTPEELKTWADANLPKIEIKELKASIAKDLELSRIEQKIAAIRHDLDTNYSDIEQYDLNQSPTDYELHKLFPNKFDAWIDKHAEITKLRDEYDKLDSALPENRNDSATRRYSQVNPRELADMPGAVDILVKMPGQQIYASDHYPESGANLLTHVRAYEHTLPDGTKALRVFELQSDWAQERRKLEARYPEITSPDELPKGWSFYLDERSKTIELLSQAGEVMCYGSNKEAAIRMYERIRNDKLFELDSTPSPNHPLLPQTQRLGLKAAIEYARQKGITKLIIDDAETAMLTEGHDQVGGMAKTVSVDFLAGEGDNTADWIEKFGEDWRSGKYMRWQDTYYRVDDPAKNFLDGYTYQAHMRIAEALAPYYGKDAAYIPQERGMRLAYDSVLPQMMRKITGDQGQRVELGLHKNVKDAETGELREDLIFKNSDKTPKTQSTGVMYDLSVPQARRSTGEPFSLGGERYQPMEEATQTMGRNIEMVTESVVDNINDIKNKLDAQYESILNSQNALPHMRSTLGHYLSQVVRENPAAFTYLNYKVGDKLFSSQGYHGLREAMDYAARTKQPIEFSQAAIQNYKKMADNVISTLNSFKLPKEKIQDIQSLLDVLVRLKSNYDTYLQSYNATVSRDYTIDALTRQYRDSIRLNDKRAAERFSGLAKDIHDVDLPSSVGSNVRYQPLGPDRATFKGRALPERDQPSRGIFAGNVEALRRSGDPVKAQFADTMDELYARIRAYTGRYESATMEKLIGENGILARMSGGREVTRKVIEAMYDEDQQNRDLRSTLNAREQKVYDQLRAGLKQMRDEQIAAGQLIDGRPAKSDPYYFPNVVDSSVIHDLSYNPTSARAKEAEAQFIEFNSDLFQSKMGMSKAGADKKAREAFGKFIGSLKPMSIDSGFDFGAVSMPAGSKLPPTWIAADPIDGLRNYIKRFSRARAFYDVVARDENAMRAIGRQYYYNASGAEVPVTNPGTRIVRDPNVRALLENAIGVTHESREGFTPAIGRLANTLLLSNVMTRVTDAATTPFKALTYLPPQYLPGLLLNMRNMRSSVENAYKTGGVRRGDMMVVRDVLGAGDQMIQRMDRVSEFLTKATGSEALEKGARFLAQNVGEYLYDINTKLAARGDKRATDFLNRLTPKWQTLAREEVAQRIAQLFQGKYDATNLPIWIQNSPAAPFFSMMKWNIEQWNNFKRFAWQPAMQGNVYPLVGTLLGGLVGGAAIGELREQISGKKQRVATLKELQYGFGEGDKARSSLEAMRKFAFLTQVTGTLGIVGELSLQAIDVASKDKPQGFSWPAFELASTVVSKMQNAASGMAERPQDAGLIAKTAADDLLKSVFTQYRIAGNAIDRATGGGEVAESNRRRDLRMSEKLRGEPTRFSPFIEREYKNERERMFDKERDRTKAREMAGRLKATARAESRTRDEYEAARRKLRASRIVGIPSRENNPAQYRAHINYVRMTQGSEAADRLAKDYQQLRTEQKWKSRLF